MKKSLFNKFIDNVKTIFYALIIALIIRSLLIQPFYIPSSSMEPTLLIGDRIFVTKYSYGYSNHSFPFSPSIFKSRLLNQKPTRGDLVVFKTPADNRTDYIKRLIGLPGDTIQFINGKIFINQKPIKRNGIVTSQKIRCGMYDYKSISYEEILPNGIKYIAAYNSEGSMQNSDLYKVPDNHYFLLGDNRDCSKDSRYLSSVGYVNELNLVGKARIIFFSNDSIKGSIFKFWNLGNSLRLNRFFKKI
jgi:signal peptidase I